MAGDIEFLPEDLGDDQPAEFAPVNAPRPPTGWRWIVLAVVGFAVVSWVVTRPPETRAPNAAPRSSASVATTSAPSESPVYARPVHVITRAVTCPTGVPVQTTIRRAMSRYLPGVVINYPTSYRCNRGVGIDQRIVFETVQGRYRGLVITLALTTPMPGGVPVFPSAAPGRGLLLLGSAHGQSPGLEVEISASGHRRDTVPDTQMQELAAYLGQRIRL